MNNIARDPKTGRFVSTKFNLRDFMNGRHAVNGVGNKVYFKAIDNNNPNLMVVMIRSNFALPRFIKMRIDGTRYSFQSMYDLKMV